MSDQFLRNIQNDLSIRPINGLGDFSNWSSNNLTGSTGITNPQANVSNWSNQMNSVNNGVKPQSFAGLNFDTWSNIGTGLNTASNLFGAWGGLQQNKLAKKNLNFQQNAFNANFSNTAQALNNDLRSKWNLVARWNPAALDGMTAEEKYQQQRLGYTAEEAKQRGQANTQRNTQQAQNRSEESTAQPRREDDRNRQRTGGGY
jgi:hypothetical protein